MDTKIIAGFFTLKEEHYDYLEEALLLYDIGHYLIGFEITPNNEKKEHFHVLFEGTDAIWNNFSKKVKGDHNLKGTGKGNKKYGKVKEIRDLEKMCSYTIKEGNYRGNFPEEDIKRWYDKSFSKNHKVETRDKMIEALASHHYQNINTLRIKAIQVLADIGDNHRPTKSSVDSLVIEHYSRTGQHKRIFAMLYPCENPPFALENNAFQKYL